VCVVQRDRLVTSSGAESENMSEKSLQTELVTAAVSGC
jgi:hypothetical protein